MRPRTLGIGFGFLLVLVVGVAGSATLWMATTGNRHALVPGQLYRAAQPDEAKLRAWIDEIGLASVVSLRGEAPGAEWYEMERAVTSELGVGFRTVRLSGDKMPAPKDLAALIDLIDSSERPTLLHCQAGVERSGLAGAVSVLMAGGSVNAARDQFGWRYGFHPWLAKSDLPLVVEDYASWLEREGVGSSAERFRGWVANDYVPAHFKAELRVVSLPESARVGEPGTIEVSATNRSPRPWYFSTDPLRDIHLVVRPRAIEADVQYATQRAGQLDRMVAPGDSIVLRVEIPALEYAGRHDLLIELVDEYVAWFRDMGSPGITASFVVAPGG